LLGVVDHYILLKVTKTAISFYDSLNTSLRDVMNGTHEQHEADPCSPKEGVELKNYHNRMHNLKEAIEIVLDLLSEKKTLDAIMVEKRI